MQKKTFKKLIGVALAATLSLTGCGNSGNDSTVLAGGVGTVVDGGGGGAAAATGGTTGFGLTGGMITGGIGGTGGGTGVTGGGGTTTTAGTTTTGGATGGSNFLNAVPPATFAQSLNNPTAVSSATVSGATRTAVVQGFGLGANQGSLGIVNTNVTADPNTGFPVQIVAQAAGSPLTSVLTSPFDVITDGSSLYISVGFGQFGNGAIIRVSGMTETAGVITGRFENITAGETIPVNPAFMTVVPVVTGGTSVNFIYWTEYSSAAGGGVVRRIRADGAGSSEVIINNLNFPCGIDFDGTRLAVCENAGGGTALGRVITAVPNPTGILDGSSATDVTEITVATGQQVIQRPFNVDHDGRNGFFFTEGASISGTAIGSGAAGTGAVRFIPNGQTVATLVSNGLASAAGIDAVDTDADGVAGVAFTESLDQNGRVLRRLVDTAAVTNATPSVLENGLFSPLGVAIVSETLPSFLAVVNYTGGQSNGVVRVYAP